MTGDYTEQNKTKQPPTNAKSMNAIHLYYTVIFVCNICHSPQFGQN